MSENPSAFHQLLRRWGITPVQAAVAGAAVGFLLVCAGFFLPWSSWGYDAEAKAMRLGGDLDTWRANAWFLLLVAACIFGGLILMSLSLQLMRGEERKSQSVRQSVYGLNAAIGAVLLLTILVLLNVLIYTAPIDRLTGNAFGRDFDWTISSMYTLSPKTASFLDALEEPVKAYVFLQPGERGHQEMTTLLRNCQARTKKFTWESVPLTMENRARLGELMQKYLIKDPSGGVLLVVGDEAGKHEHEFLTPEKIGQGGGRRGKYTFTGEGALLGTLTSLTEGRVVIYVAQGHGEPPLDGPPPFGGDPNAASLSSLKERLTANRARFEMKPLTIDRNLTRVPDDASAVVIIRPTLPYGDETKALSEYLGRKEVRNADGTVKTSAGRMMVLLDPLVQKEGANATMRPTGLEAFLAGYGVRLGTERVQVLRGADPLRVPTVINPRAANPLNAAFNSDVSQAIFYLDGVRPVRPAEKEGAGPYQSEALLVAHPQFLVWVESDVGRDPVATAARLRVNAAERNKRLADELVPVGVAVVESSGPPPMKGMPRDAAHGGGKERPLMVVVGSASWVTDQGLTGQAGNVRFDLFSSALSWLREQTDIGSVVDAKTAQDYTLTVPGDSQNRLILLPLVLMLIAVIGLGTGVWVVRRR